jgi:hypothetical protein
MRIAKMFGPADGMRVKMMAAAKYPSWYRVAIGPGEIC